jgi:3-oxoacyl-[acyl-carrier protein] reductase
MNKRYLFAGASSLIAQHTDALLRAQGHSITGISTKAQTTGYDQFHQVAGYDAGQYPTLDGPIDGLVYFPGSINLKPFNRLTAQDFLNDYQLNALGAVSFVQQYLGNLKKSDSSSIVFVSSVAARTGMPFHTSISMAKAALEGLTRSLAAELAPGIRVNAVAPSLTNTPLGERFQNTPEKADAIRKQNPMKKIGEAEEVAAAIAFLLSGSSSWITGQVIAVDGGMNNLK